MRKPTRVNHPPRIDLPSDNHALVDPIYQSVKFEFDSLAETERFLRGERPGYFYTRSGNPTNRQLEQLLAELQGRDDCLVTASGIGAIAQTLLALTKAGDHIVSFIESYNPSRHLMRRVLGRFGVRHSLLPIEDTAALGRALGAQPVRLVFFESPTNPITRIADIETLTRAARGPPLGVSKLRVMIGALQSSRTVVSRPLRTASHARKSGCSATPAPASRA